jgi:hypothetical protein
MILLAKTFGIKRFSTDDETIWNICCGLGVAPVVILILTMMVEVQMEKRKKLALQIAEKKDK